MVTIAVLLAALLNAGAVLAQTDANAVAIRGVLEAQAAAWNRGDIDGYMDGYAREETTAFIGGDAITRGWKTVLDRYKRSFDTRDKMGTLTFGELDIKRVGDLYIATGTWQLARKADMPHGRFTLLFKRTPAGWRIFHDHTSAAP